MINLKLAISKKSSSSQTNRQQTHSLYATQTPEPTLPASTKVQYGLAVACARRLRNMQRNLHLNRCGGAPSVSFCCTRSTNSESPKLTEHTICCRRERRASKAQVSSLIDGLRLDLGEIASRDSIP